MKVPEEWKLTKHYYFFFSAAWQGTLTICVIKETLRTLWAQRFHNIFSASLVSSSAPDVKVSRAQSDEETARETQSVGDEDDDGDIDDNSSSSNKSNQIVIVFTFSSIFYLY